MSEETQNIDIKELMIDFLETSNAQKGTTVLAILKLRDNEEKQLDLCRFLSKNPEATDIEIMRMIFTISGDGECPIE